MVRVMIALSAALVALAGLAAGEEFEWHWIRVDDDRLQYALSLPKEKQPGQEQRLLLVLPPGRQDGDMVRRGLSPWLPYLNEHGWIVISPIAPRGKMFFKGGEKLIGHLMTHVARKYAVPDAKFHVFGISNGGISAFRVATLHPERVRTVTVIPGYSVPADFGRLDKITSIPISIVVGSRDPGWVLRARITHDRLRELGGDVLLRILPGGTHFIFRRIPPDQVMKWITRYSKS